MRTMLTANETKALIAKVGGPFELAKLLGIDGEKWWPQRINNWKSRGMPPAVVLQHYDTIQGLRVDKRRKAG